MPIPFRCSHCNAETLVDDCYAGQSGPCATCGKTITIPDIQAVRPSGEILAAAGRQRLPRLLTVIGVVAGGLVVAAILGGVLVAVLGPAIETARQMSKRRKCDENLQRIGLAMRQYAEVHGCFPPAFVPDEKGLPMHSWRVLLLPYLNEDALYQQYDFSQPWNSTQNMSLAYSMPEVYSCPADPDALSQNETNYMVITGRRTMFPYNKTTAHTAFSDQAGDTIMVVEVPALGFCWTDPRDLDFDRMRFLLNDTGGTEPGSYHPHGANVVTADGSVHFLADETPSEYLRAMTTIDGNEFIPWEDIVRE